jgi:hypothetical protein
MSPNQIEPLLWINVFSSSAAICTDSVTSERGRKLPFRPPPPNLPSKSWQAHLSPVSPEHFKLRGQWEQDWLKTFTCFSVSRIQTHHRSCYCHVTAFCLLADLLLNHEDGGSIFVRNIGKLLLDYVVLHPWTGQPWYNHPPQWVPEICRGVV